LTNLVWLGNSLQSFCMR